MFSNPDQEAIDRLLGEARRIAVVGLSPNPRRPSHQVASGLLDLGYEIIPVRPAVKSVLGQTAYATIEAVPGSIDIVDVFRSPDQLDDVIDACIERKLPALWLQDGVINEAAAMRAQAAGMTVVMNRCIWRDARNRVADSA